MKPGAYWAALKSAQVGLSKNNVEFMYLQFCVTHEQTGDTWSPLAQEIFRDIGLCLNDKSWEYTRPKLEILGFNGDFKNPRFSEDLYEGTQLNCFPKTNNKGQTFDEWTIDKIAQGGPVEHAAAPPDRLAVMSARYKNDSAMNKKPAPPKAPPKPVAGPTKNEAVSEEDIPF